MTEFEVQLLKHVEKFKEIQQKEDVLQQEVGIATAAFQGFLKENGLPDKFTMAEALHLAVRKSRD